MVGLTPAPQQDNTLLAQLLANGRKHQVVTPITSAADQGEKLLGAFMAKRKQDMMKDGLAKALRASQSAKPWTNPDTGQVEPSTTPTAVLARELLGSQSPELQGFGMKTQIEAMQFQRDLDAKLKLAREAAQKPTSSMREYKAAQKDPGYAKFLKETGTTNEPAAVQEYKFIKSLSEEDRNLYFLNKRAAPTVNLGGTQATINPANPAENIAERPVTPKPEQMPAFKREQAAATAAGTASGKPQGEAQASLADAEASLPRLETAVAKLKELGEVATYTLAGQARDAFKRQTGQEPGEGAVARAKYTAHVKNNVLPLLRQTFGAAFTAKEGESLLATLGDPDMAPQEKSAVLDAFIADKKAELQTMRRRVDGVQPASQGDSMEGKTATNPQTGEKVIMRNGQWVPFNGR